MLQKKLEFVPLLVAFIEVITVTNICFVFNVFFFPFQFAHSILMNC